MSNLRSRYIFTVIVIGVIHWSCIERETIAGTGKEPPEKIIGVSGNLQKGIVKSTLPIRLKVRILAESGRPVRGIGVVFSDPEASTTFSDTLARSDEDGYASTSVTLGSSADTSEVFAWVNGLKGSPVIFTLISIASTGSIALKSSGDNQVGTVNEILANKLSVKVFDSFYNPVESVAVIFSTNNGSIINPVTITNKNGTASAAWKLDTIVGTKTAAASIPSIPAVSIQFKATAQSYIPAKISAVTNKDVHALSGFPVPGGIKVKLTDKYGNPASALVRFAIIEGSPSLLDTSRVYFTSLEGITEVQIALGFADTITRVYAYAPAASLLREFFLFRHYRYSPIDSLRSRNGTVELFWQRNLNQNFLNYSLERCSNPSFDQNTVIVRTIPEETTLSTVDSTVTVGTSPYYRIKLSYSTGFYFYTNIRQITVIP